MTVSVVDRSEPALFPGDLTLVAGTCTIDQCARDVVDYALQESRTAWLHGSRQRPIACALRSPSVFKLDRTGRSFADQLFDARADAAKQAEHTGISPAVYMKEDGRAEFDAIP
jgi:hypothetical protein